MGVCAVWGAWNWGNRGTLWSRPHTGTSGWMWIARARTSRRRVVSYDCIASFVSCLCARARGVVCVVGCARHRGRARSRWHLRDAPRPCGTAVMAMCASYALDVAGAIVVGVVFVDVVAIEDVEGAKTTR